MRIVQLNTYSLISFSLQNEKYMKIRKWLQLLQEGKSLMFIVTNNK